MNNKIIIAIVVIVIVALLAVYIQMMPATSPVTSKEQTCVNSGGTVKTSLCCKSSDDFPNLCLIGACGCSSTDSHEVKICECPEGKCFDGNTCK